MANAYLSESAQIEDAKVRLSAKRIILDNGCWLWTGHKYPDGYGQIKYQGRAVRVHRLSLLLFKPDEPKIGPLVLHSCDTPLCFNPDHLRYGTVSDNKLDEVKRGRNVMASKTHCPRGHEYNSTNTYIDKKGSRICRECNAIWAQLKRLRGGQ